MFDIGFVLGRGAAGAAAGEIRIGDHVEGFSADLIVWREAEYRQSWRRSAAHILEHGYGRFLLSTSQPGRSTYVTWVCRSRDGVAWLFRSLMLPSLTETFARIEDAETPAEDYAARLDDEPNLDVYRCSLRDIGEFEARLQGGAAC